VLSDDDFRGDLLAVIHGHSGARIVGGAIELSQSRVLISEFPETMDAVLALARTLQRLLDPDGKLTEQGQASGVPAQVRPRGCAEPR